MTTTLLLADLTHGLLVSWRWSAGGYGDLARERKLRPLGKVVTKADLPRMGGGPIGIQLLDDPLWVIDPAFAISKGLTFTAELDSSSERNHEGLPSS